MKIGIGIDTGGTYTDAVVYDFDQHRVLGSAKALTTRRDLTLGILEALDSLPLELLHQAEVVSLSTTLATNACVEDKGGRAKLIFLGADKSVLDRLGANYGLPPANEMYLQESFTKFSGEIVREPDWELFRANIKEGFAGLDGVGIIEKNGVCNGGLIERKARDIFQEEYDIPVVCAHQLFGELNCLQRGASTLLNARLIPIIHEFLQAIKTALNSRGIQAAISIVRSDGSLMSETLAYLRPVETLLCGPAASVIGSAFLADQLLLDEPLENKQNCLVVDMGGTTSDIALIRDNQPVKVTGGICIGKWKTFVDGLYIKTIGLGGDSAVHYKANAVYLEDYRVIPLCVAALSYPDIIDNLKQLRPGARKYKGNFYEHFLLLKDIADKRDDARYSDKERELCASLKHGPLSYQELTRLASRTGVSSASFARLINEGIIQVIGLTPTDIMHIKGDFNTFSREASVLAAEFVASELQMTLEQLCNSVYSEVKKRLYLNLIKVMFENKSSHYADKELGEELLRSIAESYDDAPCSGGEGESGIGVADGSGTVGGSTLIKTSYQTDFCLTGVGAPIHLFLPEVARLLSTTAILPKHHEVANALGAIVSNVHATAVVEVRLNSDATVEGKYRVYGSSEARGFAVLEQAEEYALSQAEQIARVEALARGAKGEISLTSEVKRNEFCLDDGDLFLGSEAIASAVGSIGL